MPVYVLKNPFNPSEEIEYQATDGTSQEAAAADLKKALLKDYATDITRSTGTGTTKGVVGALKFPIQIAAGTAMIGADAGGELLDMGRELVGKKPTPGKGGDWIADKYRHIDDAFNSAEKHFTKGYRPTTKPGRYAEAISAGVGSATVPMSRAAKSGESAYNVVKQSFPFAAGANISQYLHENPQIFGESTDEAAMAGSVIPGLMSMGRRAVLPRADEYANILVQQTLKGTPKAEIRGAKDLMIRAIEQSKKGEGVPLYPGQAFGADHPMASLQMKTANQKPEFMKKLTDQQHLAKEVKKGATIDVLPDGTPNPHRIASLYRNAGATPLDPNEVKFIAGKLDQIPIAGKLSESSPHRSIIEQTKKEILSDGKQAVIVPGQAGTPTVSTTKQGHKILTPGQPTPPSTVMKDAPIDSLGKLKSARDTASDGAAHGLEGVTRGELREAISRMMYLKDPRMQKADELYGNMADILGRSKIGVPAPNAPNPVNTMIAGSHRETVGPFLRALQGDVPLHVQKILEDPTANAMTRALAYKRLQQQVAAAMAAATNADVQGNVGLVPSE